MSHLDEGSLHALLDGELGSTEVLEIEAHLDGCPACSARLRDAREFLAEADRLVGRVQYGRFEAGSGAPAVATAAAPAAHDRPAPPPPPRPSVSEHQPWEDTSPMLLIPDNPKSGPAGGSWIRGIGWAAGLILVGSGGYLAFTLSRGKPTDLASTPPRPTVATAESQPVASAAELGRVDSATTPPAAARTAPARTALSPGRAAPKPAERKASQPVAKPSKSELALQPSNAQDTSSDETTDARQEEATRAAEQDAIRLQAARALTQLDRERRVGRAAAATAALDRTELTRPAAAAAPPPPTLEQRSQVYLRIGLDEANRQLGGPVHVIEGMSPVFMGLAPGRVAAGADTTRPVVRVVYQDPQGRTILLDQQRRTTQAPVSGNGSAWALGNIILGIRGEAPAEVLRSLRARVR